MAEGRTIRVDVEVYEELARRAKGFETPNAVLRRLLRLKKEKE